MNEELRAMSRTSAMPSHDETTEQLQLGEEEVPQHIVTPLSLSPSVNTAVGGPQEDLQALANK